MLNSLHIQYVHQVKAVACTKIPAQKPVVALFLLVLLVLCTIFTSPTMASPSSIDALKSIAKSNLKFTNSIYQILAKTEGNVFFSPISIEVILALTYLGARGRTAEQMAAGLHLPADNEAVKEGFHAMMTSLKSDGKITLDLANKLFAEQTLKLKDDFVSVATKSFLAEAQNVDFQKQWEAARLHINKWVESKTNDRITNLLPPGVVDSSTALVLVNAVYFKGDWANKFDPNQTKKSQFFLSATEKTEVDMMYRKDNFGFAYREELDCKVLELPYVGNKLSMVIFLPNEVDGLPALEAKLSTIDLPKVMSELGKPKVEVWLPKFKMELFTNLKPVLKELGMVDMFDKADLSGIADGPLAVSEVVHKAFIEVNEEGSEAAAATASIIACRMELPGPDFIGNRPFVFAILDSASNTPLFMGRLSKPE